MGTTPKPLRILVDSAIIAWPEIQALREQGHTVQPMELADESTWDLWLGPVAHRMSEGERKWIAEAVAEARRRRYPPKTQPTPTAATIKALTKEALKNAIKDLED